MLKYFSQNLPGSLETRQINNFRVDFVSKVASVPNIEIDFDPTVEIDGELHHFQRGFVWPEETKRAYIEGIFNRNGVGLFVLWEDENFNIKVIDGKQRISTLLSFFRNEITIFDGIKYCELPEFDRLEFLRTTCSVRTLPPNTPHKDVLRMFVNLNNLYVPQSPEHMKYVKELLNKM